jgi:hypothetical protein
MKPSLEFASDAQVNGGSWRTKSNTPQENYFARKRTKRKMSPGHSRDTAGTLAQTGWITTLKLLALPRGLEPLFSP